MKTQIKKLRVQIDGLAQLVETLGQPPIIVEKDSISNDIDLDELAREFKSYPIIIMDHAPEILSPSINFNLYECHKSLRLAKAWLGKVLGELGEETPYKNNGKRKEVKDIEPPADKAEIIKFPIKDSIKLPSGNVYEWGLSYIEKIDWLREEIKNVLGEINFSGTVWSNTIVCFMNVINHLHEARFHLGYELQKIKEQEETI